MEIIGTVIFLILGGLLFTLSETYSHDHPTHHVHKPSDCKLLEKEHLVECENLFDKQITDEIIEDLEERGVE